MWQSIVSGATAFAILYYLFKNMNEPSKVTKVPSVDVLKNALLALHSLSTAYAAMISRISI